MSDERVFNFFEVIAVDQEHWGVPLKPGFELLWICRIRLWIEFDLFMAFVYSSNLYDVQSTSYNMDKRIVTGCYWVGDKCSYALGIIHNFY